MFSHCQLFLGRSASRVNIQSMLQHQSQLLITATPDLFVPGFVAQRSEYRRYWSVSRRARNENLSADRSSIIATGAVRLCWLLGLSACASSISLYNPLQSTLTKRYQGQIFELRQSCYYGQLYDENELWMLSPKRFEALDYIEDMEHQIIRPSHEPRGIMPSGARLLIQRIELPDALALSRRMLRTPRFNPWVYVEPVEQDLHERRQRPFVIILPQDVSSEVQAEKALAQILAPDGQMSRWLKTRRPTVQTAIRYKTVTQGMSLEELVASLGAPSKIVVDSTPNPQKQIVHYGVQRYVLENNQMIAVASR